RNTTSFHVHVSNIRPTQSPTIDPVFLPWLSPGLKGSTLPKRYHFHFKTQIFCFFFLFYFFLSSVKLLQIFFQKINLDGKRKGLINPS
ncbi:hypothetical protein Tsubulata_046549, partial [Turnera subulata]